MLEIGKISNVGVKRRGKQNQDSIVVVNENSPNPLLVVADGMGGYLGGTEASQIVVKTLEDIYKKRKKDDNLFDLLQKGIILSHRKIVAASIKKKQLENMGSTIVAAALDEPNRKVWVANVGDSRAYLISKDGIEIISYDHSEVAELERKGILNALEVNNYARKNVLTMSLLSSRPEDTIKPHIVLKEFPPETIILLCSDGLWGSVPPSVIQLTALEFSPQEAVKKLVDLTNASGGPDNISILIARRKGEWKTYIENYSKDMEDTI